MKVFTGEQFRLLDQYTIEHEPIRPLDLMERAATALTEEIASRWGNDTRMFIFAGPGNNGGDGLAIARLLGQKGYDVRVWLFNVGDKISLDCRQNYDRLLQYDGIKVTEVKQSFEFPFIRRKDVIIDALFGTGLSKPLTGGFASVVRSINSTGATVVSIDMPSGVATEDNTYTDHATCVHADLTLTIQMPKMAFLLPENEACVGEWKCVNIDLSKECIQQMETSYAILERRDLKGMIRPRPKFGHKGTFGHALLAVGSHGMAGAAILAARSCMRSGIGKLTIHTPGCNNTILQTSIPEAVLNLDPNTYILTKNVDTANFQAIGIGCGIGKANETAQVLNEYIALAEGPIVVDADAISILAARKDWLDRLPKGSILTPHPGEMDRLAGFSSNGYERLMKAREVAREHQLVVILKGHYTAICEPSGCVFFNNTGNSGMATAGSGDVLTGLLTGLLAQGYPPIEAAVLGTWLHGSAGDLAAKAIGEECMIASDIITYLPQAIKDLK